MKSKKEYWPMLDDVTEGKGLPWWTVVVAAILLMVAACFGCSRVQYVPVESGWRDSTQHSLHRSDSIYIKDSILIEYRTVSDTVIRTEYRWHTRWHDRIVHDTIVRTHMESRPVPYPVEKRVEVNVLRWWQRSLMYAGICAVAFVVFGSILYRLRRK